MSAQVQLKFKNVSKDTDLPSISVCMAVRNGSTFLREQIVSILTQLRPYDELIITDDHSTDDSIKVAQSLQDRRIRILHAERSGVVPAFEVSLETAKGDFIFLADQDDIWAPNKVEVTLTHLVKHDLVVSDCVVVNEGLETLQPSFQQLHRSRKGLVRNLIRNSYMGCCMAFRRELLQRVLPFPAGIPVHDIWIGLVGEMHFRSIFIPDKLVYYRRHRSNATTTSTTTHRSFTRRIKERIVLIRNLMELTYAK